MNNQKKSRQPLSAQEMKDIKEGHIFSASQYGVKCPLCGEENDYHVYTLYIVCRNCGHVMTLKEEENDVHQINSKQIN